jgi:hypothetical protein
MGRKEILKFPPFAKGMLLGFVLMAAGIYAVLFYGNGAVAFGHQEPTTAAVRCFPASKWDANDAFRPCVEVGPIAEDGSARVIQRPAGNAAQTICVLHNPAEQRHYLADCRAVRPAEVVPVPLPWPITPGELEGIQRRLGGLRDELARMRRADA